MKKILILFFAVMQLLCFSQSTNLNGWMKNGNILGVNTSSIGSIDNRSFRIATNNTEKLKIDSLGYFKLRNTTSDKSFWIAPFIGAPSLWMVHMGMAVRTNTNYSIGGDSTITVYNSPSDMVLKSKGTNMIFMNSYAQTNQAYFELFGLTTTSVSGTEKIGVNFGSNSIQFQTGASALKRKFNILGDTYSAIASSTTTDVYTMFTAPCTAGTNMVFTNSYGYGTSGSVKFTGLKNHYGSAAVNTQTTLSHHRISSSATSILDIGSGGVANSVYMWADRPGSKSTSNYNLFMDEYDLLLNDSLSIQARFNNVSVMNLTNGLGTPSAQDFFALTPPSFTTSTTTEKRSFRINTNTVGFSDGTLLAIQRKFSVAATTYTSSVAKTLSDVYGGQFDAPIAGSGITITRPWALTANGNFNVLSKAYFGGITTLPTALVHLAAGTTAAATAPLKFTSGALNTTAEAGAIEFLTDNLYCTITTGAARKQIGINDIALTAGRVHFSTTNGRTTDLAAFTYATNRLSPTYVTLGAGAAAAGSAPLVLTTGTSLTTPIAGALEYTTPQLFFTNGGAIRQEIAQVQQARVATSFSATSNVALANITGLTANVAAGRTYKIRAVLFTTSAATGGVKFAVGGTATATSIIYEGLTTNAGLITQSRGAAMATTVGAVTAVTAAHVVIEGIITVNAAGTITIQFAQNVSDVTSSVVLAGSNLEIQEIL